MTATRKEKETTKSIKRTLTYDYNRLSRISLLKERSIESPRSLVPFFIRVISTVYDISVSKISDSLISFRNKYREKNVDWSVGSIDETRNLKWRSLYLASQINVVKRRIKNKMSIGPLGPSTRREI